MGARAQQAVLRDTDWTIARSWGVFAEAER